MMYIATKTGIDAAKTPSKIVFQKTAEAIADLTGNKIAGKITLAGKSESKAKKKKKKKKKKIMRQTKYKKFTYLQKNSKLLVT